MVAAIDSAIGLEPVADDAHPAVRAGRGEDVDGTLERIEGVGSAVVHRDGEGAVVDVAAGGAGFHDVNGLDEKSRGWNVPGVLRFAAGQRSRPMPARSTPPARVLAAQQLVRIEAEGLFASHVNEEIEDADDARLASNLVAGVTRLRRWLDFVLTAFIRSDFQAVDPLLQQVLRIGAYDLLERGTPPHAAVSEAVAAARVVAGRGAAALVNGVLRTLARAIEDDTLPVPATGKPERDLAVRYSHPTWLVRRWLQRYGAAEAEALLQASNARPRYALRVNTQRTSREELGARLDALDVAWHPSAYLDGFVVVERLQPVLRAGLLADGLCAVQDEAAGLVVCVLDPQPGELILDAAAAPGGKAFYAAQRMGDRGRVVAVDRYEARTALVQQAADAQGFSCVEAVTADLRDFTPPTSFDRVLLDAPCTGLGVLAKRADLRWQRTPESILELVGLQDELLDAAATHVRQGGVLVYSTCTTEPEENAERVGAFLERRPDFHIEPVGDRVPEAMRTEEGFYEAVPHRHGTDGAFAARLRREG